MNYFALILYIVFSSLSLSQANDLYSDISDFLSVNPGSFSSIKNFRQSILSAPGSHDQAADLVDTLQFKRLSDIDQAGLLEAKLPDQPWSDTYWPIYEGTTASRYADTLFPSSSDWKKNSDYILGTLGRAASLDDLSPAEKYDLLVGDQEFTFTKAQLNEGKVYYDRDHSVETWMGICHGLGTRLLHDETSPKTRNGVGCRWSDSTQVLPFGHQSTLHRALGKQ